MDNGMLCTLMVAVSMCQGYVATLSPYFIFLLANLFRVKLYKYTNAEKVNHICHNVSKDYAANYDENDRPTGLIIECGNWVPRYFCWIADDGYDKSVHILACDAVRKLLIKPVVDDNAPAAADDPEDASIISIQYFERSGIYAYFTYHSRNLRLAQTCTPEQDAILVSIAALYEKRRSISCYVHGSTGVGKTLLTYLIGQHYGGSLCDSFRPDTPGDTLESLYSRAHPTRRKPLIVLLDEADTLISNVHHEQIERHKKAPIQIYDKCTWNRFFDKIDMEMFPWVIVVLCSNIPKTEIDKLDKAYLRAGRMHGVYELAEKTD